MLQSRNPTMQVFDKPQTWDDLNQAERKVTTMTMGGTIFATSILLAVCSATAVLSWGMFVEMVSGTRGGSPMLWMFGSLILGFIVAMIIRFNPKLASTLGFVYAALQGVLVSGFSAFVAYRYLGAADNPAALGLIAQAIFLTLAILGGMLIAYATGLIRIGGTFRKVMIGAVIGVVLYSLVVIVGNGFLGAGIPNLFDSTSPLGIGFSVLLVGLAALFLVLDFQFIERGVASGAPKYMEWYAAFGLLVTLVWLYMEVIRLLAKLRAND